MIVLFHLSGFFPILNDFLLLRIHHNFRLCFKLFIIAQIMGKSLNFFPSSGRKDFINFGFVYIGDVGIFHKTSMIIIFVILWVFLPLITKIIIKFSLISFVYIFLLFDILLLFKLLFPETLIKILLILLLHGIFLFSHLYVFIILCFWGFFKIFFILFLFLRWSIFILNGLSGIN